MGANSSRARLRGPQPAITATARPPRAARASERAVDAQRRARDGRTPQPSEPPPEQPVPKRPAGAGRASGGSRLPNSVPAFARRPLRPRRAAPVPRVRRPSDGTPRQSGIASTAWPARRRWRAGRPAHGASGQSLLEIASRASTQPLSMEAMRPMNASMRLLSSSASRPARESPARRPGTGARRLPGRDQRRRCTGALSDRRIARFSSLHRSDWSHGRAATALGPGRSAPKWPGCRRR